ncbi:MAG TPA: hypothetical protein VF665_00415 [Longimicrobium sp.]|jgi:hypothetical protein|uniref:hypothetical protein n=1 Tax=Longimicrobium sp. TaxID=2029185 RepID=UPI002ED89319
MRLDPNDLVVDSFSLDPAVNGEGEPAFAADPVAVAPPLDGFTRYERSCWVDSICRCYA